MSDYPPTHSQAWTLFTMASFAVAAVMTAIGIWSMEASFAAKGFYAMAAIMLVHTTVTLTKTLRDREEAMKFHHRIEDARTGTRRMDAGAPNKS